MIRLILSLAAAATLLACTQAAPPGPTEAPDGAYRGMLQTAGGDLPFGFELAHDQGQRIAYLVNGPERVRIDEVSESGKVIYLQMPGYQHRMELAWVDGRLEGSVSFLRPRGEIRTARMIAMPGETFRFFPQPESAAKDFSGRWELTFHAKDGSKRMAIAELQQQGHEVFGTVLRPTGDDRYIAGEVRGDTVFLSRFDGGSAYLYLGRLAADGSLAGEFHSGASGFYEAWSGVRNDSAKLEDPASMVGLKKGVDRLSFTFPDLDGKPVAFPKDGFAGKVTIVTIGGSWCPNCHDEALFLRELLVDRRAGGLEVVQLMFEYTADFASASAAARNFASKYAIDYPVLIAGSTDNDDVLAKLPQLAAFKAYPTTFLVDRKGKVRYIHTGFSGPATGAHYLEQNRELTQRIDALLAEKA